MRCDRGVQDLQVRRRAKGILSPVSLRDTYVEQGEYTVKMIIDPAQSQAIEDVQVDVRNADGRQMHFSAKRWGTKLTISFKIDETTPDGVSIIDVSMRKRGQTHWLARERFDFWVVK